MDSDHEVVVSRPRSVAMSDAPDCTAERNQFAKLNPLLKQHDADRLFSTFFDVHGLGKIQEFNKQLERVLECSIEKLGKLGNLVVGVVWLCLITGNPNFAKQIEQTHPDVYEELLRLAYHLRYPNNHFEIPLDEIFEALEQPIPLASTSKDCSNERTDFEWSADYAQQGFQSKYLKSDIILDPILETLRENAKKWAPSTYKAPYTAIIGPTMSGKTRLIMELATKVPVVYICLRPAQSTGLPCRSELADSLLPKTHPKDLQLHYTIVLIAILQEVAHYFRSAEVVNLDKEGQVAAWYKHSFPTDGKTDNGKFAGKVKEKIKMLRNNIDEKQKFQFLQRALADYSGLCITQDSRLKIILAIDEARGMLKVEEGSQLSPFRHFRRVLSQITRNQGFFALFTDTTSRVANFSPSLQYDPSARLYDRGWELFPPIYQLQTLDLFASEPKTWEELVSPSRLLGYGTPFYSPYFQVAQTQMGTTAAIGQVMMIAQKKLTFTKSLPTMPQAQIFALLGPIIQPPLYTAWDLNAELLSSHAAHCMYISPTRDKVVCQYPSQLVYATAAHHFLASDDTTWVECINGLTHAVQQGLVTIGDTGELATNLILIWAMNQTMKKVSDKEQFSLSKAEKKSPDEKNSILSTKENLVYNLRNRISSTKEKNLPDKEDLSGQLDSIFGDDKKNLIPYGHPVRLKDFLEVLTGKKANQIDLGSTAGELEIKNKLFNEGIIFFNHLILIKYTPNANDFLKYLHRGVAVQCKPRQPGFDQLFTIYLKPNSDTSNSSCLDEKNVSFCGIQVKNHQGSIRWDESHKWTTTYAKIEDIKNPYLVILFNLSANIPKKPKVVKPHDTKRVLLQIHGLGNIGCLTTKIVEALEQLKSAQPDLIGMHKQDPQMEEWIKSINPQAYPRDTK